MNSDVELASSAVRRHSTRDRKQVIAFSPTDSGATKRKRGEGEGDEEIEDVDMEDVSDDESDENEAEPDEEELREQRRRARKTAAASTSKPRQPAMKVMKGTSGKETNGEVQLVIRSAGVGASKTRRAPQKKKAKHDATAEEVGGIYADVFGRGKTFDKAASEWLKRFEIHESKAIAEFFNFVLKCSGCDIKVDQHAVEDPDHFPEKLRDIQDEYQATSISDYPIIARGKAALSFRDSMEKTVSSLIRCLANADRLYYQVEIIENIESWVGTMSSAGSRPFRHTATAVALCIITNLCNLAADLIKSSADHLKLLEKAKKEKNKGRAQGNEDIIQQNSAKRDKLNEQINNFFETVFLHRYRDVDPRIRVDCVRALGGWITTYPDFFFDGQYLRYLGWVLSDTNAQTRLEVVEELQKLYQDKNKVSGLKSFTERFRARMVEMSTGDSDALVRAAAVKLLDILREAELLEPDDIDSVGRLIFDSEPRVRNAVVGFFVENVKDLCDAKIEELGGEEALDGVIEGEYPSYDIPRREWLKYKCLVEILQSYDSEERHLSSQVERWNVGDGYSLIAAGVESRYTIAAQSLCASMPELKDWKVLAGYILFDHSRASNNDASESSDDLIKTSCKLDTQEEILLIDVLNAAVKLNLNEKPERHFTKKERNELAERQRSDARHLAGLLPRLLKKFGAEPDAASAILGLGLLLDLDVFQELRQDSTTYGALLDDINKQFLTHGNERVLLEASKALLHARRLDELGEVTEGKLQALWTDTMDALHGLTRGKDITRRGGMGSNMLTALTNTVLRVSSLARISDCTATFESAPSSPRGRRGKGKARESAPDEAAPAAIDLLIAMVQRGVPASEVTPETDALEDALVSHAAKAISFYFLWKMVAWKDKIASNTTIAYEEVEALAGREDAFIASLTKTLKKRKGADDVRLMAAGYLLDLHSALAGLRAGRRKDTATQDGEHWTAVVLNVEASTQAMLRDVLGAAERVFAKKSGKKLADAVDDDDEPVSGGEDEPEDDDEAADDDDDEAVREAKLQAVLLAEQKLCEFAAKIVLAIWAGVVDGENVGGNVDRAKGLAKPMRKRLERNKMKLGANYKQVVDMLDAEKKGTAKAAKSTRATKSNAKGARAGKKAQAAAVKSADVIEDDEDGDEEMGEAGNEDAEDAIEDDEAEEALNADAGAQDEVESVLGD